MSTPVRNPERESYPLRGEFTNPFRWTRHKAIRTRLVRKSDVGPEQFVDFGCAQSLENFLRSLQLRDTATESVKERTKRNFAAAENSY